MQIELPADVLLEEPNEPYEPNEPHEPILISIRYYNDTDKTDWDNYVKRHPNGTLFHLTAWKEVVEQTFGHKSYYLTAFNNTPSSAPSSQYLDIIGILPVFRIKSFLFGDYLISIPFAELGGPLSDSPEIDRLLVNHAEALAVEIGCDYLELRNREPVDDLPTKTLYYNFKREIFPNLDENLMAIPRKARRMIRQGEKFGLTAEFGHHLLDAHYQIMARSYHSLGTPIFHKKFFENFLTCFGDNAQLLLIRNDEKTPVAAVMAFYFKDQVIPYWAGSNFQDRKLAPNDFMYWELMKHGSENGFKVFDFGRSKLGTGSYDFKRHWGFEPAPLSYQYYLVKAKEMPNLSPANPKYKKKIELWRKMPLAATKIIGPHVAKYLA
jgi:FemAB-related protein (PEP-CTERM system-associated)